MEILTLGEKIKAKRKEKNLTLKELAGDRVTPGQISLVESGKANPSIELLEYIAEKLETDVDYFLESEEKQASKICEYYLNIAEVSISSKEFEKAKEYVEKGIHYANEYNLILYKGKFNMVLAIIKYHDKKYEESQQYCLIANSLFLKLNLVEDVIKSFILLGKISINMGYYSTALNYFTQGDTIISENFLEDEFLKAKINYYIAISNLYLNKISQAIDYAYIAKKKLEVFNDKKAYADVLVLLSLSYAKEGKIEKAINYSKKAKEMLSELDYKKDIAEIEDGIGEIFAKFDNFEESFSHLTNALKIKQEIKDNTVPLTLFKLCDNYIKLGQIDKAKEVVIDILDNLKYEEHEYRIKAYEYLYKIYSIENNTAKIEEVLINTIKYLEATEYKRELANFCVLLGKLYIDLNMQELALKYMNRSLDLYKELGII
ncbi:helix-turn-helix domain-containing protein [Caloramator proteoclasticus]|uniref:Tetratricopeptide repeat-containing protein n=1 Tax=Caloramator proteoclasticus DSM 10124 TaxID=1121262 RepID=A0A1M4Z8S0_9CLOT|nr:helix-turn-helix domain-containing protein [Caloramator proteoclasticus]SHF13996.1 Tetratricopeptide repeat-containing protein [Caloramator proteoclasticus DSM 10124]